MSLHPCAKCQRHIEFTETVCPFCGAPVPEPAGGMGGPVVRSPEIVRLQGMEDIPLAHYGGPPITPSVLPLPAYGGPPIPGVTRSKLPIVVVAIVLVAISVVTFLVLRR